MKNIIFKQSDKIQITINAISSAGYNVTLYEYKINDQIYTQPTNKYIIQPYSLPVGVNKIILRVKDDCNQNNWSLPVELDIEIKKMTEQTFEVLVNKPNINIEVIINRTGTVNVTVKDQIGTAVPDATVKIEDKSSITDMNGLASISNLSYGPKTGTVSF